MAYENKEGSGKLFRNNKEGGNPNWPDYRGDALINGVKLKISAWIKTPKNGGNKYLSLSFQPDNQQQGAEAKQTPKQTVQQQPTQQEPQEEDGDDLPF